MFNGTCDHCLRFSPRCITATQVDLRDHGVKDRVPEMTLCHPCRKNLRGLYRVADKHK